MSCYEEPQGRHTHARTHTRTHTHTHTHTHTRTIHTHAHTQNNFSGKNIFKKTGAHLIYPQTCTYVGKSQIMLFRALAPIEIIIRE